MQEHNLVVGGDAIEFAQIRLSGLDDGFKFLRAMADLHHRHTRAFEIEQFRLCLFENFEWQGGRTGIEIEDALGIGHGMHSCVMFRHLVSFYYSYKRAKLRGIAHADSKATLHFIIDFVRQIIKNNKHFYHLISVVDIEFGHSKINFVIIFIPQTETRRSCRIGLCY